MDSSNSWLWSRVGARLLMAGGGGLIGWWAGHLVGHPAAVGLIGAALAVLTVSVLDTLKGQDRKSVV